MSGGNLDGSRHGTPDQVNIRADILEASINRSNLQLIALSHSRQNLQSGKGHESSDEEVYDPESEGPYFGRHKTQFIEDLYEHKHGQYQEEFRLVPPTNAPNRWMVYVPILYWLPRYKWHKWFASDVIAALTAIVMVIPQSMGYAMVAGLEPIYGLYSALMGHSLYGPLGSSGQLIVAPVAIVSLMTYGSLIGYFEDDDRSLKETQVKMAAYGSALAFQSGVLSLVAGLCGGGIMATMLSEAVIVGFTGAASILIGISQLPYIFQVKLDGTSSIAKLISFFQVLPDSHGASVWLALCCIIFLLLIKWWKKVPGAWYAKFIPDALILVIVCTAISYSIGEETGFEIVGPLPKGLPTFLNFFDYLDEGDFMSLWVPSILITILSFIESIAVATKFADKHGYSIEPSQELIALGICNLVGCVFQIYPISGVLSLATVVEAAGAITPLYSCMAGAGMIATIAFVLFLFEWLPKPVLGSIVMIAASSLLDIHKMIGMWKVNRTDFLCMSITVLVTLGAGIDWGVGMGIMASVVLYVQKSAKPHYGVLGKVHIPGANVALYRNVKHNPESKTRADMLMIRWDASLFFANTQIFKTRVRKQIGVHLEKHHYPLRWCLALCFSGVNEIDFTAVEMLISFFNDLKVKEKGMTLVLCKVKQQVYEVLEKGGVLDVVGKSNLKWELFEAERWWNDKLLMGEPTPVAPPLAAHLGGSKTVDYMVKKIKSKDPSASAPLLEKGMGLNNRYGKSSK
eukprot:50798_1